MATTAVLESEIDYVETARLATEAFASPEVTLTPERLRWLYERCYSEGATVIALRVGERKVGQLVMVNQTLLLDGEPYPTTQLVDLFVTKEFRGRAALKQLYDEAERQVALRGIRFVIALPNNNAIRVNEHFLKLRQFQRLPLRMGLAPPLPESRKVTSYRFEAADRARMISILAPFQTPAMQNGFPWDAERLFERLADLTNEFALHCTDDLLLVSAPRRSRGMNYTLLCAFVPRAEGRLHVSATPALARAACRFWRRPLFAYAGFDHGLSRLPGFVLPKKVRPSPMIIQLRDFQPEKRPPRLDRFQSIDFDLA